MGLLLRKNHLLRCWGCLSLLTWIGARTLSLLLKLLPKKLEPWFVVWSFFLLRLLCISINLPYGLTWNTVVMSGLAGAPSCYLELLDKLQKRMFRTVDPSLAASLEPLAHRRNVVSWSFFGRYCFGIGSSEPAQLVLLSYSWGGLLVILHGFSVFIPRCYNYVYVNSFFRCTARLCNSLPIECFPLSYDLNCFKSRINRHLTIGFF